jgi:predicted nucleic acid-binding protein
MVLYLLDTTVVSAVLKRNMGLIRRLDDIPTAQWCISAVTRARYSRPKGDAWVTSTR